MFRPPFDPAMQWAGPQGHQGQPFDWHEEGSPQRGPGPHGGPWGQHGHRPWGGPPPMLGRFFWRQFGPRGPRGQGGPRGPRMFGRGDLKYVLLELLTQRPMHGYEMIKALEERAGGFYTPSAGAIYPTLQLLEDRGWVRSETVQERKVYTISDEGRKALTEREPGGPVPPDGPVPPGAPFPPGGPEGAWAEGGPWSGGPFGFPPHFGHHGHHGHHGAIPPELAALRDESIEVVQLMRTAVMRALDNPVQLAQLRGIVQRTRDELRANLNFGQSAPPSASTSAPTAESTAQSTPPASAADAQPQG